MSSYSLQQLAPLPIRIIFGLIFGIAGWAKLPHLEQTARSFAHLGVPLPTIAAPAIAALELIGGIALLLGLGTRLLGLLLAIEMLVAIWLLKANPDLQLQLALTAGLLSLVISGPGAFALTRERLLQPAR